MPTTILLSSAAYVLSDYLPTSEGNTAYNIIKHLAKYDYHFHAIGAYVRLKESLPNLTTHQTGTTQATPAQNPIRKYAQHLEFYTHSLITTKKLLHKERISIIHHMFPAVHNQTFSPIALTSTKGKPFIFGPISAHFFKRPADEKILQPIIAKLHQKTVTKAHQLITITEQIAKLYQNSHKPVSTIPLGVDINTFRPATNTSNENPQILYTGALYPLKGVEHLIRAFATVTKQQPKATLKIIGKGPQECSLKHLTKTLKLETKVTFQNFVPHTQIAQYIQKCTILCFPSLGESFGKTIIEAMSCAKPVIATNQGGAKEIITDGITGILVPPAQPKQLAQKILYLLNNADIMQKLGENARKTAAKQYSWETIAEKYHILYQNLA